MNDIQNTDPRNLTFSQAYGYEPLPAPLALEQLSEEARLELWNLLYSMTTQSSSIELDGYHHIQGVWRGIFINLHHYLLSEPLDTFNDRSDLLHALYKDLILDGFEFNKVFDLLLRIMRHPNCPTRFTEEVAAIFQRCQLAYFVNTVGQPSIVPAATQREGEAIGESLQVLHDSGLIAAEAHLQTAIKHINDGDWSDSIRESIHAVESVARHLDPSQSDTLGAALNSLERHRPLHPALKSGFSSIYGYTSNEEGIRHSLVDSSESPAGRDEAIFMLGGCASFASYLWRVGQATS